MHWFSNHVLSASLVPVPEELTVLSGGCHRICASWWRSRGLKGTVVSTPQGGDARSVASASPGNLSEMQILGSSRPPETETLRVGTSSLCFKKHFRAFWCHRSLRTTAFRDLQKVHWGGDIQGSPWRMRRNFPGRKEGFPGRGSCMYKGKETWNGRVHQTIVSSLVWQHWKSGRNAGRGHGWKLLLCVVVIL